MKNIISLILVLLLLFTLAVGMVSCGDEPEEPIEIEKNPTPNDNTYQDAVEEEGGISFPPVKLPTTNE